jgi:hypothetical protein
MNKNASKEILLSVIGIVILIIAVVGVSFAYFNYAREGTKINKVNIAKVAFLYKEDETLGNGISLKDVLPIADVEGQSSQDYFDFTITADAKEAPITYDIVINEDETSTLDNSVVKIYLVKIEDAKEVPVVGPIKCSELDNYSETASKISGKLVFNVSAVDENNYKQQYRLRMWIAEDAILYEEKDGVIIKDLINKTFSIKVNVFARNINTVQ